MVSHQPPCMVALCWLLITLEAVPLPIYLQWLKMGVCVFVVKTVWFWVQCMATVPLIDCILHWMWHTLCLNWPCSPSCFFFGSKYCLLNICLCIVCCYFTALCIKSLLGEVNDCTNWKVSNTLQMRMLLFGNLVVISIIYKSTACHLACTHNLAFKCPFSWEYSTC